MGIGLVNDDLRKAAIIMASTPAMTLYPILAARFGKPTKPQLVCW